MFFWGILFSILYNWSIGMSFERIFGPSFLVIPKMAIAPMVHAMIEMIAVRGQPQIADITGISGIEVIGAKTIAMITISM